jgi:uncharacterized protein
VQSFKAERWAHQAFIRTLVTGAIFASVAFSAAESSLYEVTTEKNVPAKMRDGVTLRADVYRPAAPGRFPALLVRTPYSKTATRDIPVFRHFAARGFVVVVQDTRGRYMSDGLARPHDEADDGFDTIEWLAALPYVNGKVGMFGGSYLATTQLLAGTLAPPALVALFPASSGRSANSQRSRSERRVKSWAVRSTTLPDEAPYWIVAVKTSSIAR